MSDNERGSRSTAAAAAEFGRFAAEFFALKREKGALIEGMLPALAAVGFERREVIPGSPEAEIWLAVASHQLADWDLLAFGKVLRQGEFGPKQAQGLKSAVRRLNFIGQEFLGILCLGERRP